MCAIIQRLWMLLTDHILPFLARQDGIVALLTSADVFAIKYGRQKSTHEEVVIVPDSLGKYLVVPGKCALGEDLPDQRSCLSEPKR